MRLEEVTRPEPGEGEVRVRVTAAGVCHTELHFLSGLLDLGVSPLTLGHETAGVIEEVGPGVRERRPGDRVLIYYYRGCGRCRHCRRGEENLCREPRAQYGFISDGGFAEHLVVPERNAVPIPEHVGAIEAAPIGCSVTTALHACELAGVGPADVAVVYGIGAVGYGLVQLARLRGARVIGVGRTQQKLEKARELGAEVVIDARDVDPVEAVHEATSGRGADVVFELVATAETMERSLKMLGPRGRLIFIGYSEDRLDVHPIDLVVGERSVTGSVGNSLDELHEAIRLVAEGRVQTVVDRSLPLDEFESAIEGLRRGDVVGRVVLEP